MAGDRDVDPDKRATLKRFAALGAASPLVRFADDSASDSDTPEAIVGYLATTPAAHFSKLRDDLHLGTGEAQHHLRRLAETGTIDSWKDGDYRRYAPAGEFTDFERAALGYLRRATPRGMVVTLLRDPAASGGELATQLDVSRSTISKYASELEAAGLLTRENGYALARPETLLMLLVRYADSFGPEARALAAEADDLVTYEG
jgi:predicted transcriptional regulator